MTEFTWPDEAVEAVAEALGVVGREYANALPEDAGAYEEESVSAVLAALAPFVSAMLDEARGEPWKSKRKGEEAANLARYYAGLAGFALAEYGDEKEVLRQFRRTGDIAEDFNAAGCRLAEAARRTANDESTDGDWEAVRASALDALREAIAASPWKEASE